MAERHASGHAHVPFFPFPCLSFPSLSLSLSLSLPPFLPLLRSLSRSLSLPPFLRLLRAVSLSFSLALPRSLPPSLCLPLSPFPSTSPPSHSLSHSISLSRSLCLGLSLPLPSPSLSLSFSLSVSLFLCVCQYMCVLSWRLTFSSNCHLSSAEACVCTAQQSTALFCRSHSLATS